LLAPLFRAEEVTAYVPAFVSACAQPLQRWATSAPGSLQPIHTDTGLSHLESFGSEADWLRQFVTEAS